MQESMAMWGEVLIEEYKLTDPALLGLAEIVHGADTHDERTTLQSEGLRAIGEGFRYVIEDDHENLGIQSYIYDTLYAWCQAKLSKPSSPGATEMRLTKRLFLTLLLLFILPPLTIEHASLREPASRSIKAVRISSTRAPVRDVRLDEAIWSRATPRRRLSPVGDIRGGIGTERAAIGIDGD